MCWVVKHLLPLGWRDEQLSLRNPSDIRAFAFNNLIGVFQAKESTKKDQNFFPVEND